MKFFALAVFGFLLGAGAAWLQQPSKVTAPDFPAQKPAAATAGEAIEETGAASPEAPKSEASATTENPASDLTTESEGEESVDNKSDAELAKEDAAKTDSSTEPKKDAAPPPEVERNLAEAKGDLPKGAIVGGAFSLTDHNGNAVTEKSWPGKYLLVFFGFTNCPDVCPVTLDKLTSVLNQLGDDAAKIQPLFITVDPARDRANVMKDYVSHFHKSIIGLTGTEDQIKAAEDAYKVYAAKQPNMNGHDYNFDHSAFVYFMTPDGQLAETIKAGDKAGEIVDKIKPWLSGEKKADAAPSP